MRLSSYFALALLSTVPAFGQAPATPAAPDAKPAAALPTPIDAANEADLRKQLNQIVVIKGTVDRLEISTSSKNGRLFFKNTPKPACVYYKKEVQDKNPDWKPADLAGKDIFAVGKLTTYKDILTVTITAPQQVADAAEKLPAVAPAGTPAAPTPTPAVETGPPIKRAEAAVLQVLLTWPKGEPKLEAEKHTATWKKKAKADSPDIVVGKHTKAPPTAQLGLDLTKAKYKELPGGKALALEPSGQGVPSAITTALLAEATLGDIALPPAFAVLGDLSPNGTFDKGADAIMYVTETTLPVGSLIVAPKVSEPMLLDMAAEGAWKVLCCWQLLGAERLDSALTLAKKATEPDTAAVLERFAGLQAQVAKDGAAALRQPANRSVISAVLQAMPDHLTAKVFLIAAMGKVPAQYSPDGARLRLRQFVAKTLDQFKTLPGDRGDRRKKLKEIADAYKTLRLKCPPTLKPTPESIDDLMDAAEEKYKLDEKDSGDRAKSAAKKANEAYDKAFEIVRQEFDVGAKEKKK